MAPIVDENGEVLEIGDWVRVKSSPLRAFSGQVGRIIRECASPHYDFVVQIDHEYAMKKDQLEILSDEEAMIYLLER